MGNSHTPGGFNQKVVIVGGSFAGLTVAEKLWDHFDVTLIDMKEFFEFNPRSIRCSIDDEWIHNIIVPYSEVVNNNQGKFTFIMGKLTKVN